MRVVTHVDDHLSKPGAQPYNGTEADAAVPAGETTPPETATQQGTSESAPFRLTVALSRFDTAIADFTRRLKRRDGWSWAYFGLGVLAVVMTFLFIRATLDDSFIAWRYGETLVHFGRWNANADGPLVEAYSSPLYAVLSIVPALLGIGAEFFFKLVSLAIVVGYVIVVRRMTLPRRQEFLLLAVALASPVFYLQAYLGQETACFALLTAWLFAMLYRTGKLNRTGYLVAAAVALCRPEGIVFAALALGWALCIERDTTSRRWTAAVLGGWVVYWMARWYYFGTFFPAAWYQNSGGSFGSTLLATVTAAGPVLAVAVLGALVWFVLYRRAHPSTAAGAAGDAFRDRAESLRDAVPLALAVLSAAIVLLVYKNLKLATDPGNRFSWQLLFPVALVALSRPLPFGEQAETARPHGYDRYALLGVGIAMATAIAWQPLDVSSEILPIVATMVVLGAVVIGAVWRRRAAVGVAAVALAVAVGYLGVTEALHWMANRYRLQDTYQALGQVLADYQLPPGAVAVGNAGILPYQIDNRVIDISGLTDPVAARNQVSEQYLRQANLKMAILGASGPNLDSVWVNGAAGGVNDYARTHGFWSASGPMFAPQYFLDYWISPDWANAGVPAAIEKVANRSAIDNNESDARVVIDNLWHFPFW